MTYFARSISCHLEICDGTELDRRCLRLDDVMGRVVIFWRRMTQKMTQNTATVTSRPEKNLKILKGLFTGPNDPFMRTNC